MSAAHAYEFEVPEHSPAPAEAVDRAVDGNVVYLTRSGRRVAAVVPAGRTQADIEVIIGGLLAVVEPIVESDPANGERLLQTWIASVEAGRDDEMARDMVEALQDMLDDLRELPDATDRLAAYRAGQASAISWEQAKRELDLRT
ncbi:hypothetical protein O7602_07645 [Micromonospora sp. WMMD1128]|uniref:hypothetical protein n=1 Tax=unclassified Micromonospora TaxID=2617518 RepID=UPI00248CE7EF|nr:MULTISPECIES: hypothetical protein [unclassified Micromonospora]WBB75378.1 hypothetical protein O7602_07645 [Micromonospora sp. WMMD1128]WFE31231.1 hypothetical protein O7613_16485 [Micromonospora sp. WMMD975]